MWWNLTSWGAYSQLQTELLVAGIIVVLILLVLWIASESEPGLIGFADGSPRIVELGATDRCVLIIYSMRNELLPAWTRGDMALSSSPDALTMSGMALVRPGRFSPPTLMAEGRHNRLLTLGLDGSLVDSARKNGMRFDGEPTYGMLTCPNGDVLMLRGGQIWINRGVSGGLLGWFGPSFGDSFEPLALPEVGRSVVAIAIAGERPDGSKFLRSTIPISPTALAKQYFTSDSDKTVVGEKKHGALDLWVPNQHAFTTNLQVYTVSDGSTFELRNEGGKYLIASGDATAGVGATDVYVQTLYLDSLMHARGRSEMPLGLTPSEENNFIYGDDEETPSDEVAYTVGVAASMRNGTLISSISGSRDSDSTVARDFERDNMVAQSFNRRVRHEMREEPTIADRLQYMKPVWVMAAPLSYFNDCIVTRRDVKAFLDGQLFELAVFVCPTYEGCRVEVDDQSVTALDRSTKFVPLMYVFRNDSKRSAHHLRVQADGFDRRWTVPDGASAVYLM